MKEYFQDWGNFYQVVCTIIFGIITIVLWYQDRKKSKFIKELTMQSNLLLEQLNIIKNQDQPCLKVSDKGDQSAPGWPRITIENIGSDLLELSFNKKSSDNQVFQIEAINPPLEISRNNNFIMQFGSKDNGRNYRSDTLEFTFKDKNGNIFSQKLKLSLYPLDATFFPLFKK